jgi:hypothetical protein
MDRVVKVIATIPCPLCPRTYVRAAIAGHAEIGQSEQPQAEQSEEHSEPDAERRAEDPAGHAPVRRVLELAGCARQSYFDTLVHSTLLCKPD